MITVVLDDDPTGTQAMSDVSVILDWGESAVWSEVRPGDLAVHMLTNARAFDAPQAEELVRSAASAARRELPGCRFVLRGDSTLRGHVWEEYHALRTMLAPGDEAVPLLLAPALPAAGRVTIGGVHLLRRAAGDVPLTETEYARDGAFAYSSAALPVWAQERSAGRFRAEDATLLGLERLRADGGAAALAGALEDAHSLGRPAVVVPDAETQRDLEIIADAVELAEANNTPFLIRCAPALVVALTSRTDAVPAPAPLGDRGVLVVCGSFVSTTTEQIERLAAARPGVIVHAHVAALASEAWADEAERLIADARRCLADDGLAVIVTERKRDVALIGLPAQRRVASALASVARGVRAGVVIAKGGITSAVTAREGLGAKVARVLGTVCPGVALWKLADGTDYLVVPGNFGGDDLLVGLVARIAR